MTLKVKGVVVVDDNRLITNVVSYNGYVPADRLITVTGSSGISGGGNLSANRVLSVDETWMKARYTSFSTIYSVSNNTISTALGIANTSNVSVAYVHSGLASPTDTPIANTQGAGIVFASSMWKEPAAIHVSSTSRVFARGASVNTDVPWTELWSKGNLPNPALNSVSLSAGNGLVGGGDLTANRSFAVGAGNGISVGPTYIAVKAGNGLLVDATGVFVNPGDGISANSTHTSVKAGHGLSANSSGVHVIPGNGLSANLTHVFLVPGSGSGLTANTNGIWVIGGDGITANTTGVHVDSSVARTSATITAGNGLSGGGQTGSNIRFDVKTGLGLGANSTGVHILTGAGLTANATSISIDSSVVRTSRKIDTAWGILGGGDFSADRTFEISQPDLDSRYALKTLSISPGDGIAGGGNLTTNRTISVDSTVLRNFGNQEFAGVKTANSGLIIIKGKPADASVLRFEDSNGANTGLVFTTPGTDRVYLRAYASDGSATYYNAYLTSAGVFAADEFIGKGNSITELNASQLTSGTVPDARLSASIVRTNRGILAGNGLTGGGDLSTNRSMSVVAANGISVSTAGVGVNAGTGLTANGTGLHVVTGNGISSNSSQIFINAGDGMSVNSSHIYVNAGTGLTANITGLHVNTGNVITANSTHIYINAGDGLNAVSSGLQVDSSVARTSVSVVAGNGLSGGGTIGATRTISMGTPGSIVPDNPNSVSATSHTHFLPAATVGELTSRLGTGTIGTYAFLNQISGTKAGPGVLVAGSNLRFSNAEGNDGGISPPGTWRCMGQVNTGSGQSASNTTGWLRTA